MYVSLSASMSALLTAFGRSPEAIAVPSTLRVPAVGNAVIFTLSSVSSLSAVSEKLKSPASNVDCVSPVVVSVLSAAVGAALLRVSVT